MGKKVAIGCGIFLVLLIVATVLLWAFLPNFLNDLWNKAKEAEGERQKIATEWKAPNVNVLPAAFFPAKVEQYQLEQADTLAAVPDLRIEAKGVHGRYAAGNSRIDLFAYPVNKADADKIMKGIEEAANAENAGNKRWTKVDLGVNYARMYLRSPKFNQVQVWYTHGWLLVFRTTDDTDCEPFIRAFLKSEPPTAPKN